MKKTLLTLLACTFLVGSATFAQGNASSYYRKIASEQRKIRTKQVIFYNTSLQFTDAARLSKSRDMVLTQIDATKKIISKTPAYLGDSAMRNDYARILDIYTEAYTTAFDSVQMLSKTMGNSEADLKLYQDAFYHLEDLVDDAEYRWEQNEVYFTNYYAVTPMEDPTATQLSTLRALSVYVQDIRSAYASVPFLVKDVQAIVKKKQFDNLEDSRLELAQKAEQAMVSVTRVGNYVDENEEEDDFLKSAALYYLEYVKSGSEEDFEAALLELDEARYEESESRVEKAKWKIDEVLQDFVETELDLNERINKFVAHYVKE